METQKSSSKLGVGISFIIILAVVGVTFFFEKGSSDQVSSNTQTASSSVVDNTIASKTQSNKQTSGDEESVSDSGESENSIPSNSNSSAQNTTTVPNPVADTVKKTSSKYVYKNGTYTATGSYDSPGGMDQLDVTVTINNDIVTNSSVSNFQGGGTSQRYYNNYFANGYYLQYVKGQNIANLNLGKVSRSSLTPQGFNDALNQIRSQAKA